MNKRNIVIAVCVLTLLVLSGVVWYGKGTKEKQEANEASVSSQQNQQQTISEEKFVTDVDSDVNHWQTKETEFFTIKFPKEWYWIEIPGKKPGQYGANVISNNPNFPLEKYSDIGIFTGSYYHATANGQSEIDPSLNDSEVVISNYGWATSNSGTPKESIEWRMQSIREMDSNAHCNVDDSSKVPLSGFCSFVDGGKQKVQTYFLAYNETTFGFTARTANNNIVDKSILEKISKSLKVNDPNFH